MSDELIFDSERQEQRAKKKRRLIPLLVLAGILIAVVVIALILRSGKEPIHPAGEDTPYPYTWQAQHDGSLLLEISHADAPDYRWTLSDGTELHILSAEREAKEKKHTTRFVLTPKEAGRDMLELKLLRESASEPAATESATEPASEEEAHRRSYDTSAPEDVIYKLTLLVEFTRDGDELTGAVLSSSGVRCQGVQTGGADSANPYQIYAKDERRAVAAVKIASLETDWSCEILSGESSVTVEAILYDVGEVGLHLTAGEVPGESELVFRSEAAGAELRLKTVTQTDGALLITEHQAEYGEKTVESPPDGEEQDAAAATAPAGADTEPEPEETQTDNGEPLQKKTDLP